MAAPVPAVERATRILQCLAGSPQESFTAAEVAAAVGVHRATCFSILASLTDSGLVHRDAARKTYRLGPELVRLGAAARDQHRGVPEARQEMYALARELDVGGLVCVAVGGEIVVLERVGDPEEFELPPIGHTRAALAPPIGGIFVAWSGARAIEDWLARSPAGATTDERESYRRSLAAIRTRGYSIGSMADVELQLEEVLARLESSDATERLTVALELADYVRMGRPVRPGPNGRDRGPGDAPVRHFGHLVAPVFDDKGEVAMTLTLYGRPDQINEGNVGSYADPLLGAASSVTQAAGGRWPR
jgi:DNA-binding IclR family transcriptional regulator